MFGLKEMVEALAEDPAVHKLVVDGALAPMLSAISIGLQIKDLFDKWDATSSALTEGYQLSRPTWRSRSSS